MVTLTDLAQRIAADIKARSLVGHTHTQVENENSTVRLDSAGQVQHLVGGVVRTQFNTSGEMVSGTVPTGRVPGLDTALYTSGPRRLTTLDNGWTGDVRSERNGRRISLTVNGINGSAATSEVAFPLPVGIRPSPSLGTVRMILHTANGSGETATYRAYVTSNSVRITGGQGLGVLLYSEPITFLTDDPIQPTPPWPAA